MLSIMQSPKLIILLMMPMQFANTTDSIRSNLLFCHTNPLCKQALSILKSLQDILRNVQFTFVVDGSVEESPTKPLSKREYEIDIRYFVKLVKYSVFCQSLPIRVKEVLVHFEEVLVIRLICPCQAGHDISDKESVAKEVECPFFQDRITDLRCSPVNLLRVAPPL